MSHPLCAAVTCHNRLIAHHTLALRDRDEKHHRKIVRIAHRLPAARLPGMFVPIPNYFRFAPQRCVSGRAEEKLHQFVFDLPS